MRDGLDPRHLEDPRATFFVYPQRVRNGACRRRVRGPGERSDLRGRSHISSPGQEATFSALNRDSEADFAARARALVGSTSSQLRERGFGADQIRIEVFYNCRFQGSSTSIMILQDGDDFDFVGRFTEEHRRQYGFVPHERPVIVDDVRVRATGVSSSFASHSAVDELENVPRRAVAAGRFPRSKVFFDSLGWAETAVAPLEDLVPGEELAVSHSRCLRDAKFK